MRNRYLREADSSRHFSDKCFVLLVTVAMHEDDGNCPEAFVPGGLEAILGVALVKRDDDLSSCADAFLDFHDLGVQQRGQLDMPIKNTRSILVADAQLIAKALGDEQYRRRAFAFEQGIGGDSRAHLHRFDLFNRDGRTFWHVEKMTNSGDRSVAILLGVF